LLGQQAQDDVGFGARGFVMRAGGGRVAGLQRLLTFGAFRAGKRRVRLQLHAEFLHLGFRLRVEVLS